MGIFRRRRHVTMGSDLAASWRLQPIRFAQITPSCHAQDLVKAMLDALIEVPDVVEGYLYLEARDSDETAEIVSASCAMREDGLGACDVLDNPENLYELASQWRAAEISEGRTDYLWKQMGIALIRGELPLIYRITDEQAEEIEHDGGVSLIRTMRDLAADAWKDAENIEAEQPI